MGGQLLPDGFGKAGLVFQDRFYRIQVAKPDGEGIAHITEPVPGFQDVQFPACLDWPGLALTALHTVTSGRFPKRNHIT